MKPNRKDSNKYTNHDGDEMYRYNWVVPLRVFRLIQEAANAEGRTITRQLTVWVKEGYTRWKVKRDGGNVKP
jgi:hypothetical protein